MMQLSPVDEQRYKKLQPWLTYPLAITERLNTIAGEAVLHKLHQGWTTPNAWVRQNPPNSSGFVVTVPQIRQFLSEIEQAIWCREIQMVAHQDVCWYARSIFPKSTFENNPAFFAALDKFNLGDLIFKTPGVIRDSLEHYVIDNQSLEFQWLPEHIRPQSEQVLWLRFASYRMISGQFFYLMEIFLPAVERYCEC